MTEIVITQSETREQVDLITNNMLGIQSRHKELQQRLQSLHSTASKLHQRGSISQEPSSVIRIPASIHRQQSCRLICMCRCHKKTTLVTPSWMQQLIGTLFIGYNTIPSFVTCNERTCKQQQNQLIDISYYFPFWLLKRAFFLRSHYSPMEGCMVSVRTPRVVSHTSPQFILSRIGHTAQLQELFSQGLASPFDIEEVTGTSCLQVRKLPQPLHTKMLMY